MSLHDAVAKYVENGDTLAIGGFTTNRKPYATVSEILRQGQKDFIVYAGPGGGEVDMLIGEGRVAAYINCYTANSGYTNVSRRFRAAIAKQGKRVLFVATKKQAKEVVADKAASVNMPYVTERWPGGMLTNFPTIRKAIKKMANIDKLMNDGTYSNLSKREILQISRQRAKLEKNLGSISDLTRLPAALFVVDVCKEHIAVKEAQRLGIPVFGIVDTNSDPNVVDYIIPANDDSNKSIEVILDAVCGAIAEGIEERKAEKVDAEAAGEGEAKTRNKRASKARADKDEAAEAPAAEAKAE